MGIGFPLIQNFISLFRAANSVQHVTVALAVDTFLKSLYGQA